jgi:type I restriction enzyme S subunit
VTTVALGEVVDFYSGGTPSKSKPELWQGNVPWFSAKDMKRPRLRDSADHVADAVFSSTPLRRLPAGTIAMVVRGMILAHTVPISILDVDAAINQDLKALIPKRDLDTSFLAAMLRAQQATILSQVSTAAHGTKKLDSRVLETIQIPFPPLAEQRRIAAILDHADALRAKRRQVLANLDALTQSMFHEMFGGDLPTAPLGDLAETRLGKMLDAKKQTGKHRRPYLRNANVQWFRFDLGDLLEMDFNEKDRITFALQPGDVLVCEGGQPGRSAIWRGELAECYFQKALHRVRLGDELEPEYFTRAMKKLVDSNGLKDYVTSSTIAHLTGEKLRTLPVPVPSLDRQREFKSRVVKIRQQEDAMRRACAATEGLFASLQSRAFRGEL